MVGEGAQGMMLPTICGSIVEAQPWAPQFGRACVCSAQAGSEVKETGRWGGRVGSDESQSAFGCSAS